MSNSERDMDDLRKRDTRLAYCLNSMRPLASNERERIGVAIKDSIPIPDDPDGYHTVEVQIDSGSE